jgi:hypothetical protein
MALIDKFPEIKLPNKFYRNNGQLGFEDEAVNIENDQPTFSNGSVYADLDNDGDLDIVVNNIDAPVLVYENKTAQKNNHSSLRVDLKGPPQNIHAIGSKLIVYANKGIRTYEKFPTRGFLSSMEVPLLAGLKDTKVDSILLIWPDNSYQHLTIPGDTSALAVTYNKGLPVFDYNSIPAHYKNLTKPVADITNETGLHFLHQENHFVEFDREPLIPHMCSTEGPAITIADINHDGLEDVFIGAARNKQSAIFLQQPSGKFTQLTEPALKPDSIYEDVDACWADVNRDGNLDLIVASGGNEFYGDDSHNTPRVYLNDGKGMLTKRENAFSNLYLTASCVAPEDINGDGYPDLFIGARAVPWGYGEIPRSCLMLNDGTGKFKDVTEQYAPGLSNIGFVTQALWFDIDKDGDKDLLLSLEWGGLCAFMNDKGKFTKKILTDKKGWWNFLLPVDIDGDGDIDLVAGNLGLNSRLKASPEQPVRMYYNDFDGNGKKEQILTYYVDGQEIPFANKAELEKQLPMLKKKFLYAEEFAKASLKQLLPEDKLSSADVLTANYFANAVFINDGKLQFEARAMPVEAQFTPYKDAVVVDANGDGLPDILLMGNYYDNNIQMGRYDADYGTLLINHGHGNFSCSSLNGLEIKGQVRHIRPITINKEQAYILAKNDDSTMVIKFLNR